MNCDSVTQMYTKPWEINGHTNQLRNSVKDLMLHEEKAVSKRKTLQLELLCDDSGQLTGGSVTGDMGTVNFKKFTNMGLPSGDYDLKVTMCRCKCAGGCRCSHPHVRAETHNGQNVTGQGEAKMNGNVKQVEVELPVGKAMFETFEVEGKTHWLGGTEESIEEVNVAINALCEGKVSLKENMSKTVPWLMFEGKLLELGNVCGRLETMQKRVNERHLVSAEDGWLELFGHDTVNEEKSKLRVCMDEDYSIHDLRQALRTTDELQKSLTSIEDVRLNGDVEDVMGNLCHLAGVSSGEYMGNVNKYLSLREELHESLRERTLKDVVETRVKFLTMAVVDAGLRHEIGTLCQVDTGNDLRQAKLCRYQLGQIYANNERNERQLTKEGYEKALERMNRVIGGMMKAGSPSQIEQTLGSKLTRTVCKQKVLEGLSRTQRGVYSTQREMPIIAPVGNYMYEEGRGLDRQGKFRNDAHRMFVSMVNSDRQHRLITPLVHRHLLKVAHSLEGVDEVMDMYDKDLQPFLGMALGGPEVEGGYAFLDKEGVRTGYDEEKLFNMLVNVMFV